MPNLFLFRPLQCKKTESVRKKLCFLWKYNFPGQRGMFCWFKWAYIVTSLLSQGKCSCTLNTWSIRFAHYNVCILRGCKLKADRIKIRHIITPFSFLITASFSSIHSLFPVGLLQYKIYWCQNEVENIIIYLILWIFSLSTFYCKVSSLQVKNEI